jgi:hypothetical protein
VCMSVCVYTCMRDDVSGVRKRLKEGRKQKEKK